MTGALKLFGVGVAFGVEIAAATFGFSAWLKAGWEGLVYALTGVGLIGGGLVPITSGRSSTTGHEGGRGLVGGRRGVDGAEPEIDRAAPGPDAGVSPDRPRHGITPYKGAI